MTNGPSLKARVADVANLERAFAEITDRYVRDARPLAGGLRDIELHLADRLGQLSDEIRADRWEPGPLRRTRIRKPDGSWRPLKVPAVRDRIVERALAQVLSEIVDPDLSPWSFAYRRGLGVRDAIDAARMLRDDGLTTVVRCDIEDCFDSIPRQAARAAVARWVDDPWLLATIDQLLERPTWGAPERASPVKGVPQGAPLSPLLANLVLDELDTALPRAGCLCVRYADDLLVALREGDDAHASIGIVSDVLATLDLRLNKEKLRVTTFDNGISFLGEELGPASLEEELRSLADRLRREDRRTLYVTRQGAYVSYRSGQVRVSDDGQELLSVPLAMVGNLVLCGAVTMSSGIRNAALHDGIDVVFLSRRGRYLGRLEGPQSQSPRLIRLQYSASEDRSRALELARAFVAGKIANHRALLQRYGRRDSLPVIQGTVFALREHRRAALRSSTSEQLMGTEGIAARAYFDALGRLLPPWAGFTGRNRRPPRDPANAVLSFGYALLEGECTAALRVAGLDPSCGFLHGDHRDRPSLALDLMEELRPLIVDTVVLDLFRRGRVEENGFTRDGDAVLMTDPCRRLVIEAFETRLISEFAHVPSGRRTTYRRAIALQAQQIARWCEGKLDEYRAVSWR